MCQNLLGDSRRPTNRIMAKQSTRYAFKFQLEPTAAQIPRLMQMMGASRFAHNHFVAVMRERTRIFMTLRDELMTMGLDRKEANKAVSALAVQARQDEDTLDSDRFDTPTEFGEAKEWLTPLVRHHRNTPANEWDPDTERFQEPWAHLVPRAAFLTGLKNAETASKNHFDSLSGRRSDQVGRPRFKKSKDKSGAVRFYGANTPIEVFGYSTTDKTPMREDGELTRSRVTDYSHIYLSHLGMLKINTSRQKKGESTRRLCRVLSRDPRNRITQITVSQKTGFWHVAILIEEFTQRPRANYRQRQNGIVGVDLGVKNIAALSTGEVVDNPRIFKDSEKRIKHLQRKLARQEKGSNRYKKTLEQKRRLEREVSLRRATIQNELTKKLASRFRVVVIEDLEVKGMTRSAKGSIKNPGKNVKVKARENRATLDVGMSEIRRQLEYKTKKYGARLVVIDQYQPSSKMCSNCGSVKEELPVSVRKYKCDTCGIELDRDINAALNLKAWASEPDRVAKS